MSVTSPAGTVVPLRLRRVPAPPLEPPYDDERDPAATGGSCPGALPLPFAAPRPTPPRVRSIVPADGLPPAAPAAAGLVRALLDALAGLRPVGHLTPVAAPAVCDLVARRATAVERAGVPRRPGAVRSLHVSEPARGVAEVCAVVELGDRVRALALRMEIRAARWRCTALQLG